MKNEKKYYEGLEAVKVLAMGITVPFIILIGLLTLFLWSLIVLPLALPVAVCTATFLVVDTTKGDRGIRESDRYKRAAKLFQFVYFPIFYVIENM